MHLSAEKSQRRAEMETSTFSAYSFWQQEGCQGKFADCMLVKVSTIVNDPFQVPSGMARLSNGIISSCTCLVGLDLVDFQPLLFSKDDSDDPSRKGWQIRQFVLDMQESFSAIEKVCLNSTLNANLL